MAIFPALQKLTHMRFATSFVFPMINIEVMINLNRESTNLGGHLGKLVVAPKFHLVKLLNQDHQTQTCQIIFLVRSLVRNYSYS